MVTFEKTLGLGSCGFEVSIQISQEDQYMLAQIPLAFILKNYCGGTWDIRSEYRNPNPVSCTYEKDRYFWAGNFKDGIWKGYFNTSGDGELRLAEIQAQMENDLRLAVEKILETVRKIL